MIAAALAEAGHLNERGQPFNPKSMVAMVVLVAPVLSLASPITGAAFIPNSTNTESIIEQ